MTTPINRMILLGASNLTLSLRLVIDAMQQRLGSPSEALVAVGHGRAYGICSSIMTRKLPSILESGLWQELVTKKNQPLPTYALLTDIGNDILYGLLPQQIIAALQRCIEQLQQHHAQIVMTNVPIASIEGLTEVRYLFFRNIFYPSCQLPHSVTLERARELHAALIDFAARHDIQLYEQSPNWFGPDGIHVDYWQRQAFYTDVVRRFHVLEPQAIKMRRESPSWLQRPTFAYKGLFGYDFYCAQPSGLLTNGSQVCKY